jgi:spermidine/putrescine transport system permease protein
MSSKPLTQVLFTLPALVVFLLFFASPFSYFFVVSFWRIRLFRLTPDFTFDNYIGVAQNYLYPLGFTFCIALVIAVLTIAFAFGVAYLIRFVAGRWGAPLLMLVLLTLFGGYLVKIYAWKTILGSNGIVNTALVVLGIIDEPLPWLLYNPGAVVVTLLHFLTPLAVLPIYGSLRSIADIDVEAARDLGATPWRVVKDIVLPQCRGGLMVAFVLVFLISAGDYVTPRMVGGTNTPMVGNFVESQFVMRLNAPQGSALAYSILALALIGIGLVHLGLKAWLKPR